MIRQAVLGAALTLSSIASAELPQLSKFDNDTLIKTDVIWAVDYTLPVYVQRRFAPERPLDVQLYVKAAGDVSGLPPILGIDRRRAQSSLRWPRSEFESAQALEELTPYVDMIRDWADRANYMLVSLQPIFGEYDFATQTFPFRLSVRAPMRTSKGDQPLECYGKMWPAPGRNASTHAAHIPCLRVLGIDQAPAAFTSLRVEDPTLAKQMKESQHGNRYWYLVLTKPAGTSLETLPRSGQHGEDVAQVVTMEPLGLYVVERATRRPVLIAPLTPAPRPPARPETAARVVRAPASAQAPALRAVPERAVVRRPVQIN